MNYSVYRNNGGMLMTYFNLICEELCITGGKVIHIDTNVANLEEVHKIVTDNADKYPNSKWELYPMHLVV